MGQNFFYKNIQYFKSRSLVVVSVPHFAVGVWGGVSSVSGVSSISGISGGVWESSIGVVVVCELRVSFGFPLAKMVDSSIGVVKSVVDSWESIYVVSVGVYSSVVDVLGISFSFTFAKVVDSSIGVRHMSSISGNWGSI